MRKTIVLSLIVILAAPALAPATTRLVPSEYDTIQDAIDDCNDGDVVIVGPNTYTGHRNRNINFGGRAITVKSENGPESCIIDCENSGRGFYFGSGEQSTSVLDGFTITNGSTKDGSGLYCKSSSPTITNCAFRSNSFWGPAGKGGGMYCESSSPTISNCIFSGNNISGAGARGGGIYCFGNSPILTRCAFIGNNAGGAGGKGGGIYCDSSSPMITNCTFGSNAAGGNGGAGAEGGGMFCSNSTPILTNCTFTGNTSYMGGGGIHISGGNPTFYNCIVWGNLFRQITGGATVLYSDVQGGFSGEGNIDADPLFVDATDGDYRLQTYSLCIDSGTNEPAPGLPSTDIEGNPRSMDGDHDGIRVVDMGAYEFREGPYPSEFKFVAFKDQPNPPDQTLSIWINTDENMLWQITEDCPWLKAEPNSGEFMGEAIEVAISVNKETLVPGDYTCELNVTPLYVGTDPWIVLVKLHLEEYFTIQAAIDEALSGTEVIVPDGTYTGQGNRNIDFKGKAITVRSENGPNNCIIDCQQQGRGFYFHNREEGNSVLKGFTIINGKADKGAGIYFYISSPTIINCLLRGNSANHGGGFYAQYSNSVVTSCTFMDNSAGKTGGALCYRSGGPYSMDIRNCAFINNSAGTGSLGNGGAICNSNHGVRISNCIFIGNTAARGGGMYNSHSSPIVTNCTFSGNSARWGGGGISNYWYSSPTLTNCTFSENSADHYGGGMYHYRYGSPTLTNCTFASNSAPNGKALACDSWEQKYPSDLQLTNCILWDGGNEIWNNDGSTIAITYSDVEGGWAGVGNIDDDPMFVEPGYWADANDPNIIVEPNDPNAVWVEGDYRLLPASPCIDAASDANIYTDIEGNIRPFDFPGIDNNANLPEFDMGAYEATVQTEGKLLILPEAIRRYGRAKKILAILRLPKGVTKDQIDSNEPLFLYPEGDPNGIEAASQYVLPSGRRRAKRSIIFAFFDKAELMEAVPDGRVQLHVVGMFDTRRYFHGTDNVWIKGRQRGGRGRGRRR